MLSVGFYNDGKKIGTWKIYYHDTLTLQSEMTYTYNNEIEYCEGKYYDHNGIHRMIATFVDKKREGVWKYYDERGVHEIEHIYKNDTMIKEINPDKYFTN